MAKSAGSMALDMAEVVNSLTMTVTITGMRTWAARLWVGKWLLYVAAHIIGTKIEIEIRG